MDARSRRIVGQEIIDDVVQFATEWKTLPTEAIRKRSQEWTRKLRNSILTDREVDVLWAVTQELHNYYSDRSLSFTSWAISAAVGPLLMAAASLVGNNLGDLPRGVVFYFVAVAFVGFVLGVFCASRERRWKSHLEALNEFGKALAARPVDLNRIAECQPREDENVRRLKAVLYERETVNDAASSMGSQVRVYVDDPQPAAGRRVPHPRSETLTPSGEQDTEEIDGAVEAEAANVKRNMRKGEL